MRTRAGERQDTPTIANGREAARAAAGHMTAAAPAARAPPGHTHASHVPSRLSGVALNEQIAMPDGGEMGAYLALPESGSGPGMLVLMEIFGVGVYIREATDRLAGLGYVALAPDLYRRTRPGAEFAHDDAGLQAAFPPSGTWTCRGPSPTRSSPSITFERGRRPVERPAYSASASAELAFGVATGATPQTAVSYYGSGVADMVDDSRAISCPVLFQFGGEDDYIPREQAERLAAAAKTRDGWECHIHDDGGHAFDNWDSPRFWRPEAAKRAGAETADFLRRTLPTAIRAPASSQASERAWRRSGHRPIERAWLSSAVCQARTRAPCARAARRQASINAVPTPLPRAPASTYRSFMTAIRPPVRRVPGPEQRGKSPPLGHRLGGRGTACPHARDRPAERATCPAILRSERRRRERSRSRRASAGRRSSRSSSLRRAAIAKVGHGPQ